MSERATDALLRLLFAVPDLDPQRVWSRRRSGIFAAVTEVPFPTLNGVWAFGEDADPREAAQLLRDLPADGVPYCLQAAPGNREAMAAVASDLGMLAGPDIPLMDLDVAPDPLHIDGLVIRELSRDEFDQRCEVAAAGFGAPAEAIRVASDLIGGMPGYRMYLGEVDGTPVTTAVGITDGDAVGIFDVATPAEHRGRGYGAAITVHAIREGYATGATWAWLQSSEDGYRLYERLGLRTRQRWALWVNG